ncbi:aminoacyl-tRNA deacylase [Pseudomonas panipatensis]|uniref:Ala-tRNA(Pro) deacylase n=1 Tax=Pseudomonas panipatensis TaxID=428992 RepID=A0A1G8LIQ8_9PSED|nr:YbaK/EbsC family protein [Pseudomonas panipatensis]SDI55533.1 Ala-tRNA(Pro) deacylase [Pseudomonas panipatensis]SMP74818.1 Ala-tRNA(Pro) deacylase [Pseudomonas panipatensis]
MSMATRLQSCLTQHQSHYDLLSHTQSMTTREAARRAGIQPQQMAKPVILDDFQGHWLMAVVPASRQVDLHKVHKLTRRNWRLAKERDLGERFEDCALGAIPAVGNVFGLETLIDQSLSEQSDIYFEAGDHNALVHMTSQQYLDLMPDARLGRFCE